MIDNIPCILGSYGWCVTHNRSMIMCEKTAQSFPAVLDTVIIGVISNGERYAVSVSGREAGVKALIALTESAEQAAVPDVDIATLRKALIKAVETRLFSEGPFYRPSGGDDFRPVFSDQLRAMIDLSVDDAFASLAPDALSVLEQAQGRITSLRSALAPIKAEILAKQGIISGYEEVLIDLIEEAVGEGAEMEGGL